MKENKTAVEKFPDLPKEVKQPLPATIKAKGKGLQLSSLDDMWRFAGYVITSGLAPKGIDKAEGVVVALQFGFELGLSPMQSIQNIAVINKRPCLWGDAVPGLVESSGKQEYGYPAKFGERKADGSYPDNYGYKYITKRVGRDEYTYIFTVGDAKKAKLWGKEGPWTFYPDRMLLNRARTFCIRDVYPDVLKGIYTVDEVENIVDAEFSVEEDKPRTEKVAELLGYGDVKNVVIDEVDTNVDTDTGEVTEKVEEVKPDVSVKQKASKASAKKGTLFDPLDDAFPGGA